MTPAPSGPSRAPRLAPRKLATAFGVGFLLALTTSGGIAGERVTRGAFAVALVANAAATLAALLAGFPATRWVLASFDEAGASDRASGRTLRPRVLAVLVPQLLGATAGIALVHVLVRREALGALPWLSERPGQFVNDVVAVLGLLALVWASARGLDARLLFVAFVGVTLYRLTAPMWHLDHAPGGFDVSVQQLVIAQFVAAAVALGIYRAVGRAA